MVWMVGVRAIRRVGRRAKSRPRFVSVVVTVIVVGHKRPNRLPAITHPGWTDCSELNDGPRNQPLTAKQIAPGRYQAHFAAEKPGAYVVAASVTGGAKAPLSTKLALFVDYADKLLVQPSNERLLRSVAASSGGDYDPVGRPSRTFVSPC